MPLTVFAEGGEGGFVAAGLIIDVIGRLTRFRRLDVIAHASTSALAALGLTPREIGRRLGVRYLTQGALWLARARMRLSFDLIDAETERVLWSQNFDRPFDDVFEVEAEIATALVGGLMIEIDHHERARVRARNPESLDAYELCLRGLDEMLRLDRSGCDSALAFFTRAAEREQDYARALSGISRAHGFYWKYRWTEQREAALARAGDFALRAIDSDVNDASANAALGWVALYSRKHDQSLAAYARAMELNPSDADILAEYADALRHSGSPEPGDPALRASDPAQPADVGHLPQGFCIHLLVNRAIRGRDQDRPHHAPAPDRGHPTGRELALSGHDEAARRAAEVVRLAHPGLLAGGMDHDGSGPQLR